MQVSCIRRSEIEPEFGELVPMPEETKYMGIAASPLIEASS